MTSTPAGPRRVALYVSGSVAAYRACEVVTGLRRRDCEVRVAMTAAATRFVGPMTLQSLSGNPVAVSQWDEPAGAAAEGAHHGMAHIGLGAWAEVQVAVPASADLIARLAHGLADDAVTATVLACDAPLLVVPAMETRMWRHQATVANVAMLRSRGVRFVGPVSGRLASGHEGEGRMADPGDVVDAVLATGSASEAGARAEAGWEAGWLGGRRVVVTAGGTREPIDPVRYVGNHSSGKMGVALAREAARLGAHVTLITAAGLPPGGCAGLDVVEVSSAAAMLEAVRRALPGAAILLMAAAVADYRPAAPVDRKLKKSEAGMTLDLVRTVDILAALRDDPASEGVFMVGFAAETDDVVASAARKLSAKGLDLIVANDISRPGIGMGADDNAVTILTPDGGRVEHGPSPKPDVARRILEVVRERLATT